MTTWFLLPGGKAHLLVQDDDVDRFPLGRAHCAPFERRRNDTLHETNEIKPESFCTMCAVGVAKKGKK